MTRGVANRGGDRGRNGAAPFHVGCGRCIYCDMTPIALTDRQMAQIEDLDRLIPPWRRDEFLRELATRLRNVELGDGAVHRIAAKCLRDVLARPRSGPWMAGGEDCA